MLLLGKGGVGAEVVSGFLFCLPGILKGSWKGLGFKTIVASSVRELDRGLGLPREYGGSCIASSQGTWMGRATPGE